MSFLKGNVIDGKAVAQQCREDTAKEVAELEAKYGKVPGLAVIIVGSRKDSQTYVRMKRKACADIGIQSFETSLPEDVSEETLVATVRRYNWNPAVHGILVQLPLPKHINEKRVLSAVSLDKDVDGFHPQNVGELCMKGREPAFSPCTPLGCICLLDKLGITIAGKRTVVVGRSNIVGIPVAMLLNKRDATVTICHSRTTDMATIVREADIVVAAAGSPGLIRGSWLKQGAVLIDVGTNSVDDPSKKSGYRLVGDADFESCKQVASAITPVPGGVGPMTIAMLLHNTTQSAKHAMGAPSCGLAGSLGVKWVNASAAVAAACLVGVLVYRALQRSS